MIPFPYPSSLETRVWNGESEAAAPPGVNPIMEPRQANPSASDVPPLVLFDGDCGMCNRLVQFLVDRDTTGHLHFAPLQAPWVQGELQARSVPQDLDSMIFLLGTTTYVRSEAARQVGLRLPGWPRWIAMVGGLCPTVLRDPVYRLVATSRRWVSRRLGLDSCRLLTAEIRSRIHDGAEAPSWLRTISLEPQPGTVLPPPMVHSNRVPGQP